MWERLFKNFSRFVVLSDEEQDIVKSLFKEKRYRRKQFILQEGEVSRYESFIVKGCTRTYEVDEKGQEHVVYFGPEDWWVGDLYSFLSGKPSAYNIDCLEDCIALQISKSSLETLYEKVPKTERFFRILVQNAFIAAQNRIASALKKTAAERYNEFMEKYPHIARRVPDHQIASFLGIAPQSLSRLRKKGV